MSIRRSIPDPTANPVERLVAAMPGWLLLIGGLTLLGMAVVTPAWLTLRDLQWQQRVMEAQLDRLLVQQQRYAAFLAGIESEDPVLLEHLAYTQLRMTPVGKDILHHAGARTPGGVALPGASVAEWLHQPLPQIGTEITPLPELNSRLTRLTRGPTGTLLCVAALICVLAGVFWPGRVENPQVTRPWLD